MNWRGIWAIYKFEMHRFARTLWTGLAVPVITTSLYFVVFGSAIGSRMSEINGIDYGSFIVPGLMMLSLFTESIFNASFGIHMPAISSFHLPHSTSSFEMAGMWMPKQIGRAHV